MFVTQHAEILEIIDSIDPIKYARTRNYLDGAVTKLSPYISRGVITTKQVAKAVLSKGYKPYEIDSFLRELAWRDYFQQVWIELGPKINDDVKQVQSQVSHFQIPQNIVAANTGISAIDDGIKNLYETGYMHNHMRMYVAGLACNIAQSHWLQPARWMYFYLFDADWASNALSWQWVAGSFSNKKYFANQENINKYCFSSQKNTYLDVPYDVFETMAIPKELVQTTGLSLKTNLPESQQLKLDDDLPVYVYNFYNLDSLWDSHIPANRVLLLEPGFFEQYPVSSQTMDFVLALSKNIEHIQLIVGAFDDVFDASQHHRIHFKEHPTNQHCKGIKHERDWMFSQVKGYYPSFFSYWKKCEKYLPQLTD